MIYDYIIIGGGPAGLAFANCCIKNNKTAVIIDKENSLGGCHRVIRVNGLFTEHGPRIYSNRYKTFNNILNDMNIKWDDVFAEYNEDFININKKTIFKNLKIIEIWHILFSLMYINIDTKYSKKLSLNEFMINKGFTQKSKDYINSICILSNGANIETYSLFKFLSLLSQQGFYNLYQPKKPLDIGLFNDWHNHLISSNLIDVKLNSTAVNFIKNDNKLSTVVCRENNTEVSYSANDFIFAIPPYALSTTIYNTPLENSFGDHSELTNYSNNNIHLESISISYHFDSNVDLSENLSISYSDWGIGYIVVSNYMKFYSKVIISTTVAMLDKKSKYTNKTANESSKDEVIIEAYRQLKLVFHKLPNVYNGVMSPNNYKNINNIWKNVDTAYIKNMDEVGIPFQSPVIQNLYTVGTHNDKCKNNYTSIESSSINSIECFKQLNPNSETYDIELPYESAPYVLLLFILLILISISCVSVIGKKGFKKYKKKKHIN